MFVAVTVTLDTGDHFSMSAADAAQAVLDALGGDASRDTCTVAVTMPTGVVEPPPPAPPTETA